MEFTINWMDHCGNSPDIELRGLDLPPGPAPTTPAWEQRQGVHRCNADPLFVRYFYNDMSGRPTNGFGGAVFTGTYLDGNTYHFKGAWSSRASVVNKLWPDDLIVEVDLVNLACPRYATAIRANALIEWRRANPRDWGLAWVIEPHGEMRLEPTRNGQVKKLNRHDRMQEVQL